MFAATLWLAHPWPLLVAAVAASLAYATATVALGTWDERELALMDLRKVFSRSAPG